MPHVAINIVSYNSASTIDACLESVLNQTYRDFAVFVADNASQDGTLDRLMAWQSKGVQFVRHSRNRYYAAAHNWLIRGTESEFVLTLNPDVVLYPDYLARALATLRYSDRIGSVNGKLLAARADALGINLVLTPPPDSAVIDGAGLMMRRSRRPYLRGMRQMANTHCREPAFIFGADGACALYRRAMLEDVAVDGECFDGDFVIYREDVDLAWRAQLLGWESYFCPEALAYHARGFPIGRGRQAIDPVLRRHSVRNGWMLLVKNDSLGAMLPDLPWILPYQLKILAGMMVFERSSLGAIPDFFSVLPRMRRKRRLIQGRRKRSPGVLRRGFVP